MKNNLNTEQMDANADKAASFLKSMANSIRLRIMCRLLESEKTAGEMSVTVGISQANMSQHLSWLKKEDLVKTRRERTTIYYSLNGDTILPFMNVMYEMFCKPEDD